MTVPNGPSDVATFGVSNAPDVRVSNSPTEVGDIVFSPGASPFTITSTFINNALTISGAGVINDSGVTQNFATVHEIMNQGGGEIVFRQDAKAGSATVYTIGKDAHFNVGSALTDMYFVDNASAEQASISVLSSQLLFEGSSTADRATITSRQGIYPGGEIYVVNQATLADATVTVEGATSSDATAGHIFVGDEASAGNAILSIRGGSGGGLGGFVFFYANAAAADAKLTASGNGIVYFRDRATGGTAQITLASGGVLDVSGEDVSANLTIGSLRGNGLVQLGHRPVSLSIGANNFNTNFDGLIRGTGSITKVGHGKLRFTQPNTYTGGTLISRGVLSIDNVTGSGSGSGPIKVNGGTLRGMGTVAGAVTIGSGSGTGAALAPGSPSGPPAVLTIMGSLLLDADSTFRLLLDTNSESAGAAAAAAGVTIASGALFIVADAGTGQPAPGTLFLVLNNTAATSISGTFANLADGETIMVGSNNFQANYEGGDGNDLTLTVIP